MTMAQQYVITVDVDDSKSDDPVSLSGTIADAVHGAVMTVPGVEGCQVVGIA
jgi:hypothetical protein